MQIDNVIKQLQYDGHYELADFLLSTIEGLKGEVERLQNQLHRIIEDMGDPHETA